MQPGAIKLPGFFMPIPKPWTHPRSGAFCFCRKANPIRSLDPIS